jgi:succinoglycan biosynthesis transport protein ExoP
MELKRYIYPLRRWWWLILAATLLAALASFIATLRQPPVYNSITTLMIGQAIMDPNPSSNEFQLGQQLAVNYAEIADRDPIRIATMEALGLDFLPPYIVTPNSQFLEISVTDSIPGRAQAVANELARQLILLGPAGAGLNEQTRQEFVNKQLDTMETQIQTTQEEVTRLQGELGNMVSARQISDTQNQINALQTKLTTLQSNYADLLSTTLAGAINSISVIEPAGLPRSPIGPNRLVSILLAAGIGFVLAAAAAYLLDYLDDTVKLPEDLGRITNYPIVGYLSDWGDQVGIRVFVADNPRHPVVEGYRTLRTNLEYTNVDEEVKTIFVASADTEDGKSSVASNLAVVLSQAEKKVILVDADLRKPNIHTFFGLPNDYGLSEIFRGKLTVDSAIKEWNGGQLSIITAGDPPPNSSELLGSKKMGEILNDLKARADLIIVDGPPFLVADATTLAVKVDGVLVVIRSGYTHEPAVRSMLQQLDRVGARVLGLVLNCIPKSVSYYGGDSYYATHYGVAEDLDETKVEETHGWLDRITSFTSGKGNNGLKTYYKETSPDETPSDG